MQDVVDRQRATDEEIHDILTKQYVDPMLPGMLLKRVPCLLSCTHVALTDVQSLDGQVEATFNEVVTTGQSLERVRCSCGSLRPSLTLICGHKTLSIQQSRAEQVLHILDEVQNRKP
jgi:hypothetical protein